MKRRATLVALAPQLIAVVDVADKSGLFVRPAEGGKPADPVPPVRPVPGD